MDFQDNKDDSLSETGSTTSSRVGYSGPLSGPLVTTTNRKNSGKKSARFKDQDECYVEITLDVRDDSVSVQNIKGGDSETAHLASRFERKNSSSSSSSSLPVRLRQVSQELKRMASAKRFDKVDRTKSGAARALKGLKFMTKNVGTEGWGEVEKRFDELAVNGMLPKSGFGQCIGKHATNRYLVLILFRAPFF